VSQSLHRFKIKDSKQHNRFMPQKNGLESFQCLKVKGFKATKNHFIAVKFCFGEKIAKLLVFKGDKATKSLYRYR
jgi:hypothetical protein